MYKMEIFHRNLENSSRINADIIIAAVKLHNFVINVEQLSYYYPQLRIKDLGIMPYPILKVNNHKGVNGFLPIYNPFKLHKDRCAKRDYMVARLESCRLLRPALTLAVTHSNFLFL